MSDHPVYDSLPIKYQLLVDAYPKLENPTWTDAYMSIYDNCTKRSAQAQVSKLKKTYPLEDALRERLKDRRERTEISQDYVLKRILDSIEVNVADLLDQNHNLKPVDDWPDNAKWALKKISVKEHESGIGLTKTAEFISKEKMIELLGKHLGTFSDKVEHSGKLEYTFSWKGKPPEELKEHFERQQVISDSSP